MCGLKKVSIQHSIIHKYLYIRRWVSNKAFAWLPIKARNWTKIQNFGKWATVCDYLYWCVWRTLYFFFGYSNSQQSIIDMMAPVTQGQPTTNIDDEAAKINNYMRANSGFQYLGYRSVLAASNCIVIHLSAMWWLWWPNICTCMYIIAAYFVYLHHCLHASCGCINGPLNIVAAAAAAVYIAKIIICTM